MFAAELFSRLIGRALPRAQGGHERLPNLQALPILSSDALSSVAYATEASLGVLILAGSSALKQSLPITLAIIALMPFCLQAPARFWLLRHLVPPWWQARMDPSP